MSAPSWSPGDMAEVDVDPAWMPVESPVIVIRRRAAPELALPEHWVTLDGDWVCQDHMVTAVRPLRRQERASSDGELTPQEIAALDQALEGMRAIGAMMADSMARLQVINRQGAALMSRIRRRDLQKMLAHPDMAHLDAQLDGFYGV